ncbi:TVP38/TMEM64 family protein [Janibacter sp. G56]|uniref:TVP38/TMEM64 family protein n=1 Tax=Janibacter sp. G56 TaxID=3418717 RepID=UPI003D044CAE
MLRVLPSLTLLLLVGGWFVVFGVPDVHEVQAAVRRAGVWGPVVFTLATAVICLIPGPGAALSVLAGVLFGVVEGTLLTTIGATVGAGVAYVAARPLGPDWAERASDGRLDEWRGRLADHSLWSVLVLRIIPVTPFGPLSIACGVLAIGLRPYLLGTALGLVPSSAFYAAIGALPT